MKRKVQIDVIVDDDSGEAVVVYLGDFIEACDGLTKIDILKDVIHDLQREYDIERDDLFGEKENGNDN